MPSSENRGEGLLRRLQVLGLCSMERGQNRRGLIEALRSVKRLTDIHANNPFEFSALCGTMGQSLILQGVIFGWDWEIGVYEPGFAIPEQTTGQCCPVNFSVGSCKDYKSLLGNSIFGFRNMKGVGATSLYFPQCVCVHFKAMTMYGRVTAASTMYFRKRRNKGSPQCWKQRKLVHITPIWRRVWHMRPRSVTI